jgi:threonine dehydrogenase-like Zn-dependent dehydrogenase
MCGSCSSYWDLWVSTLQPQSVTSGRHFQFQPFTALRPPGLTGGDIPPPILPIPILLYARLSTSLTIRSDVHFWKHGHIGPTMIVTDECGAGHESAGEVIEVGEGVVDLKVGDRVAIEAGVPCGQADCEPCREGEYKACKSSFSESNRGEARRDGGTG